MSIFIALLVTETKVLWTQRSVAIHTSRKPYSVLFLVPLTCVRVSVDYHNVLIDKIKRTMLPDTYRSNQLDYVFTHQGSFYL